VSQEPKRLVEGPELSDAERELLDAGRALAPVQYDVAAGAARFRAALEAAAAGGAAAGGAAGAAAGVGLGLKLTLLLLVAAGVGLGALALRQAAPSAPDAPGEAPVAVTVSAAPALPISAVAKTQPGTVGQTQPRTVAKSQPGTVGQTQGGTGRARTKVVTVIRREEPRREAERRPPVPDEVAAEPEALEPEAATPEAATPAPVAGPAAAAQDAPAPAPVAESVDELRSIAGARRLLGPDPKAALALLERVARAHPRGFFVEERRALTVLALAALERDAAEAQGAAFLRDYPRSPHAARVRAALER
jgi:hypothetical protein